MNYYVIVERYPFPNGVVNGSIPTVNIFSLLGQKKKKKKKEKKKTN